MANLLFADDEPQIWRELEKAAEHLRRRGHTVRVVADGEAAVAAIDEERPDILVTDVMMPRQDGFYAIKRLRELPGPRAAVVVLTVISERGRPGRFAGDVVDDYIMKPCHKWQVVLTVDQWLDRLGLPDPNPDW